MKHGHKVEIPTAQVSMIGAMSQSTFEFREIIVVDVDADLPEIDCTVIEERVEHLRKDQWRNQGSLP